MNAVNTNKKLTVSSSPHFRSPDTSPRIMIDVIIALVPSLIAAFIFFGPRSLLVVGTCVVTCVLAEYLSRKAMKRHNTISDFSAVVTGLLLAFNLPVTIPLWIAAIGSVVAIVVVKQFFGGVGKNFVNPALVGRIVLMSSFATQMSSWTKPLAWMGADVTTTASPLATLKTMLSAGDVSTSAFTGENLPSLLDMFLGNRAGCLGESCALALILGGIYLCLRRVIKPTIPLCYIGTVALIMLIAGKGSLTFVAYELLGGGLMLGAIFMATDYATTPINTKGMIIFGIGCGLLTSVIRLFGSLPEGVSFSIIIMNILVPHIEHLTTPRPFGSEKKKKAKEETK